MEEDLKKIVDLLKQGGVVVLPADSAYAIVADLTNQKAVKKLNQLKRKREAKPYSAFFSDVKAIYRWCRVKKAQNYLLKANLSGPFTFILEVLLARVKALRTETLGVRVIENDLIQKVCEALDVPLSATSANPSDLPPAQTVEEAKNYFDKKIPLYIDGDRIPKTLSSAVIDVIQFPKKPFRVLRKGPKQVEIPWQLG